MDEERAFTEAMAKLHDDMRDGRSGGEYKAADLASMMGDIARAHRQRLIDMMYDTS